METQRLKEPKLAVKIVSALFLAILPFVLLFMAETLLSFLHRATASRYFESDREALERNNIVLGKFILNPKAFLEDLKSSKIKVAIFGGSSAMGYAAPIGFSKFIEEAGSDRLIVHNYAEPGAPFVGFQDEVAKAVMPFYDVIIIYSGHNEIWSHVYQISKDTHESVTLPWGERTDYKAAYLKHNLKLIELRGLLAGDQPVSAKLQNLSLGYVYRASLDSRILHLLKAAFSPTGISNPVSPSDPDGNRLHYFSKYPFIDEQAKKEITDKYIASITEVRTKLRPAQKLIISALISNDLFPPLLDAVGEQGQPSDKLEDKAASIYRAIERGDLVSVAREVSALPDGAHRRYVESVICMGGIDRNALNRALDGKCLDLALFARKQDSLPVRVLPEINSFIRSLPGTQSNLSVIDPEAVLKSQKDQASYTNFFVDFQHPSSAAHMLIASEILHSLFPRERIELSQVDECERYVVAAAGNERPIEVKPELLKTQLQTNINWLDGFMKVKRAPSPFMYELYREKAVEKLRKCVPEVAK